MTRHLIIIITILFANAYYGVAQTYSVNDVVPNVTHDTFLQTQPISGSKVVFIEEKFTLKVSKADLINTLKVAAPEWGKDSERMFNIVIDYLSSTDKLTFKYIWTKAEDIDDLTWSEAEKSGANILTKKLLKDNVCSLLEQGNFELFLADKKENDYFFGLVNTEFGKSAKGLFTTTNQLIWVCPPWISCGLPRF